MTQNDQLHAVLRELGELRGLQTATHEAVMLNLTRLTNQVDQHDERLTRIEHKHSWTKGAFAAIATGCALIGSVIGYVFKQLLLTP